MNRIICYSTGSLGDTLLIIPSIKYIKNKYKNGVNITLLSDNQGIDGYLLPEIILKDTNLIDKFITYKKNKNLLKRVIEYIKLFIKIFNQYDELYYFQEVWVNSRRIKRDKLFFKISGVKRIYGLNNLLEKPKKNEKTITRAQELLIRIGLSKSESLRWALDNIFLDKNIRTNNNELINIIQNHNLYLLSPFSNMPSKNWPIDRYIKIVKYIRSNYNLSPIIIGPKRDKEKTNELLSALGFGFNLCDKLNFSDIKFLIANCKFYIGNDSGLMHLSNALKIPTFNFFSSRDFIGRWEPLGINNINLRSNVECSLCHKFICDKSNLCLKNISIDFAITCFDKFIKKIDISPCNDKY